MRLLKILPDFFPNNFQFKFKIRFSFRSAFTFNFAFTFTLAFHFYFYLQSLSTNFQSSKFLNFRISKSQITQPLPSHYLAITQPLPGHYLAITQPLPSHYLAITQPLPSPYLALTQPLPSPYLALTDILNASASQALQQQLVLHCYGRPQEQLLCKMDDNGPCPGTDGQNLTLKLNRQLRLSRKDCKDLVVMHAIMQQGHQLA